MTEAEAIARAHRALVNAATQFRAYADKRVFAGPDWKAKSIQAASLAELMANAADNLAETFPVEVERAVIPRPAGPS